MSVSYEGATGAPASGLWTSSAAGPNSAMAASGETLRRRSRAGFNNDCLLRSAISKGVSAEVGKGVTINSLAADDTVRLKLNQLWKEHSHQLDPWGAHSFGSILSQCVRARKTAGEIFIRRLPVRLGMGLKVPLQVEMLEADFCPYHLSRRLLNGNRIKQGIEFAGRKVVAYWFHKSHPNDGTFADLESMQLVRVPARDVIHHKFTSRAGQIRGEPDTAAALLKANDLHEYSGAELVRKKTRAGFTGFLYRDSWGEEDFEFDPITGKSMYGDEGGEGESQAPQQSEVVQAGTVLRGTAGEKLQLFDGDAGGNFTEFAKHQALELSAALGIPYPLLTSDWSNLSDRTIRAIMNEYRRSVVADQTNLLNFQVIWPMWQWFVNAAILCGEIQAKGFVDNAFSFYNLDIVADAPRHLHPVQDVQASQLAISNLFSNPEKEAAERGADLGENMRATARSIRLWRETCIAEGVDPDKVGIFGAQNGNDYEDKTDE